MPVIRISDTTFARLQLHAVPLQDTVDDVVIKALDALDKASGKAFSPAEPTIRNAGGVKTPQRDFRVPLMEQLEMLGGIAEVRTIREALRPLLMPKLNPADLELVSTGEERWWNAVCWERNDLVKEGLFQKNSRRGVWALSDKGRMFLRKPQKG